MSHFNLLEAKIKYKGDNILMIKGQLNRLLVKPYFHVLITDIKCVDSFILPYKQGDTCSLSEFTKKLYESHFSLSEPLEYPNSEININIKRVDNITD